MSEDTVSYLYQHVCDAVTARAQELGCHVLAVIPLDMRKDGPEGIVAARRLIDNEPITWRYFVHVADQLAVFEHGDYGAPYSSMSDHELLRRTVQRAASAMGFRVEDPS